MEAIEIVNAVTGAIESLGMIGLLVWWVTLERNEKTVLSDKILEDWDDLRRDRTKKADDS